MSMLEIGGAQRELRYPWKSVKRLRAECGINLLKGGADAAEPETVTALVWAGLLWEQPDLSRDTVDEWITLDRILAIEEKVAEALEAAFHGPPANP